MPALGKSSHPIAKVLSESIATDNTSEVQNLQAIRSEQMSRHG